MTIGTAARRDRVRAGDETPTNGKTVRGERRIGMVSVYQVGSLLLLLGLWQAATELNIVSVYFTSSPWGIMHEAWTQFVIQGTIYHDLVISGEEFGLGWGLAIVVGLAWGVLIGYFRTYGKVMEPYLMGLSATPIIALLPLYLAWFGTGLVEKVAMIFTGAVIIITINVAAGVRAVDQRWIETARAFSAGHLRLLKEVVLPATVPFALVGIRLGAMLAIVFVFVSELYSGNAGVGYMINNAGQNGQVAVLFVGVAVMSLTGIVISAILLKLERGPLGRFRA